MKISVTCGSLLLAIALAAMAPAALAQDEIADPDAKCLKCHSKSLKKSLEDGDRLSLQVTAEDFGMSVHNVIGCTGCHRNVGKGKHPSREPIASHREYSLAQNETCRQCHSANYDAYQGSIHASLAAHGDKAAPVCSDCHSAHAIRPMAVYEPVSGEPCKRCHESIYEAYAQSVHGQARAHGNTLRESHVQAPICADCHTAHEVSAVAANNYLKTTCLDCHEGAEVAHREWLPNASLHMDAVACAACHSPMAERRVDLQLYDKLTRVPVGQREGGEAISERIREIDSEGDGLDPVELWKLVRQAGNEGSPVEVTLRGRMEVTAGTDAHRLAASSQAVRSCESCHEGRSGGFENVTVSVTSPDGRKQRYAAEGEVLSSVISVDSVGGFYAPGGTRIRLLDGLLVLAVLGGLAVPVGHLTLGRILRRKGSGKTDTE